MIIALTICAEAGNQDHVGRFMIGEVIKNRSIQSGRNMDSVCLAPKQFSAWNNGINFGKRKKLMKSATWKDCLAIATAISQPGYVPVSPATHYFNPSKASPSWAKRMRLVAIVGAHQFYAENK